jgi:serine/threonine protein kinase
MFSFILSFMSEVCAPVDPWHCSKNRSKIVDWFEALAHDFEYNSYWQLIALKQVDYLVEHCEIHLHNLLEFTCICAHFALVGIGAVMHILDWTIYCEHQFTDQELHECLKLYVFYLYKPRFDTNTNMYLFHGLLGKGNSSVVEASFKGDLTKGRYAVKIFKMEFYNIISKEPHDQKSIRHELTITIEFIRELNAIGIIGNHEHACQNLGAWVGRSAAYVIFKKYDSCLADVLNLGETTNKIIKRWIHNLLHCLRDAHSRGLSHRDIKPHNIMIMNDCDMFVGDWDSSSYSHMGLSTTNPITTVQYRAPELLVEGTHDIPLGYNAFKLDTWAVGCILLFLLYKGKDWFTGYEIESVLTSIISSRGNNVHYMSHMEPVKARAFPEIIHRKLGVFGVELLECLLHLDPVKRFTAQEALDHHYFKVD